MTKKTESEKPNDAPPPAEVPPPVEASPPPPNDDDTPPLASAPPVVDESTDDDGHDSESTLDSALADVNAELETFEATLAEANARKAALLARRDALIEARDANRDPHANTREIRRYLDSQQAAREARGEQWRRVREAGVDLKALLPQKAPVDQRPARPRSGPRG